MPNLRLTLRQLAKTPGFTATAIATLALCIGANLTIFAVIDSVLLRPLPFSHADRLVTIYNTYPGAGVDRDGASVTNYYERRGQLAAFENIALFRSVPAVVGEAGTTERVDTARVSPEFFATLGLRPTMGRSFSNDETTYQTDSVVILTDAYWRQHFNADPAVLGRDIRVDGVLRKIVGVLPPNFRYLSAPARLYFPLSSDARNRVPAERHSGSSTDMIARLNPGVSIADAQAQIDAHNAAVADSYPNAKMMADAGFRSVVVSLHGDHVASIRPTLLLLQAGAFFLLLIGSVNLANLLLIRASGRAKEIAIRQSMGATSRHVIGAALLETVLLTFTGGLAGLALAAFGVDLVAALGAERLPLGSRIALSAPLALLSLVGALVLGVLIALPIAWLNLRTHLANALQSSSRGSTASRSAQRLRHAFIVTQIALAFVLLSSAGLLGLSLRRALAVSPGFTPDHLLSGRLTLPWSNYHEAPALLTFTDRLLDEIERQPGVAAAAVITNLPFSGNTMKSGVSVKGRVLQAGESNRGHYTYGVTGDYFAALGIPLQQGRFLDRADAHRPERVCVVDEDFARRYFPRGGALGQQLFRGGGTHTDADAYTVVGVVGAVKQADITESEALGAVYFPFPQRADLNFFVVTRARVTPEALAPVLQGIVRQIDPELPLSDLRSMDTRIADSLVARRSPALLAGVFAAVALLLAAIGTYGVLSYAVAQRHREIGVRLALGALPAQISRQFLALGVRLLALGTVLGVGGALLIGRALQTILFDVPAAHPTTLGATVVLMSLVSLIACWLPARRAMAVDPMVALRAE